MLIREWTGIFEKIYSKVDANRTPEQMWIAVMAHTSSIGESIRKVAFERLLNSAAHTFCWLCSFVYKCNVLPDDDIFSISDPLCGIITLKYPDRCGHCRASPCKCDPVKMEAKPDKSALYSELLRYRNRNLESYEKYSIQDFKDMFHEIYGGRGHIQTLENIGFHFLEEIGEAAVYIRKLSQLRNIIDNTGTGIDKDFLKGLSTVENIVKNYDKYKELIEEIDITSSEINMLKARVVEAKMGLVIEIADSFSWFCAVLNKLDAILKSIWDKPEEHESLKPLEEVLNDEYIDSEDPRCPTCKSFPCKCVFYNIII